MEEEIKVNENWFDRINVKLRKVREQFVNPKTQNKDFG